MLAKAFYFLLWTFWLVGLPDSQALHVQRGHKSPSYAVKQTGRMDALPNRVQTQDFRQSYVFVASRLSNT